MNAHLIDQGVLDIHAGQTIGLVIETQCNYFAPLAFPQTVEAGIRVARLGGSFIETSGVPFSVQKAVQDYPVTLYTAADCKADCDIVRAFLRKRGIPFAEKALASEEDVASFKKLFNSDGLYFPSLTVGSQKQQGFEEQTWHGLLDNAGYPRTAIPGAAPAASSEPAPAAQ